MPDTRRHRGPHPQDQALFAGGRLPVLREAAADLCWLLTRGYSPDAALKLVGDRHALAERQRRAVARCCCSDALAASRASRRVEPADLDGRDVALDGLNVLITVETALSGGLVLAARDGAVRDLSSVHGSYRKVVETPEAVRLVGAVLAPPGSRPARTTWLLDRPVSNSGRLRALLLDVASGAGWDWTVELHDGPDRLLAAWPGPVATSDSWILDRCASWCDLAGSVVRALPSAWLVDLAPADRHDAVPGP